MVNELLCYKRIRRRAWQWELNDMLNRTVYIPELLELKRLDRKKKIVKRKNLSVMMFHEFLLSKMVFSVLRRDNSCNRQDFPSTDRWQF